MDTPIHPEQIVDIALLLQIIAWLVGAIVALIIYTWIRFERKQDKIIERFEKKQDEIIYQLTTFIEEFIEIKKDTEYLKKDVGEIKLDIHQIKKKVNLI